MRVFLQSAMRRSSYLLALFATTLASLPAAEYDFTPPPSEVTSDLEVEFTVFSEEEIRLETLPDHPRIVWLPTDLEIGEEPGPTMFVPGAFGTIQTATSYLDEGEYQATFRFIPQGAGNITPPPVPISIGGQRILLRLPKMAVAKNQHADLTEMITMWNGEPGKPKSLRIGQTVDLDILSFSPVDAPLQWRVVPKMRMDPVRWYRATVPYPKAAPDLRFIRFGRRIFKRDQEKFRDREYWVQRYKTRFTVLSGERLKGTVALTLEDGNSLRTHHQSIDVPISPMPPKPGGGYTDTGLVGDCKFIARFDPAQPTSDKPFRITLDIEASGDSQLLQELDFSRAGFRSIESKVRTKDSSKLDRYYGRFTQTLIADGSASTFPAINLLNFDTPSDAWKVHRVTETLHFADLGGVLEAAAPLVALGNGVQRPILLNLYPATFGAIAAAPLLPLLAGLLARRRGRRDPLRSERRREFNDLRKRLGSTSDAAVPALLDDEAIPLLRAYCDLPDGASTRELADALEKNDHADLAKLLREHADAAFSSSVNSPATRKALAPLLTRISFAFLLFFTLAAGDSRADAGQGALEAAATDFAEARYEAAAARYEKLLTEHPDHVALHFNLARARLAAEELHGARASAHTAVLLDPLDKEARELLNTVHRRLGDPPLPGSAFLALRPDQLLSIAVGGWVLAFFFLALRRFKPALPRWPAMTCFALALTLLACALWRNSHAYAPDQYMVVTEELPREPEPGQPSYDYPPLRSGAIVRASTSEETPSHLRVETTDTSFWLPAVHLQKIW